MKYSNGPEDYARFVDGMWVPITTMYMDVEKTVPIGGNNPMPRYLYAALVTQLDMYMRELETPILRKRWSKLQGRAVPVGKDL